MAMRSKMIELKLSEELLNAIDQEATKNYQSRSQYVRQSITLRLNNQTITNQPSEEDKWRTLVEATLNPPPGPNN
jgi:metal-responsive CopG/Arc/MetJ family transcriptional regulator